VDAGENMMTYVNEPVMLMPEVSTQGTFIWSPSQGLNDPLAENPEATVPVTTEFTLQFTDLNGCSSTDVVTVIVDPDVTIPTALTPNGDQINDVWDVKNLVLYPNCKVEIFNRTGNRVFNSTGYTNPWDGGDSPAGTYFYIIDLGEAGTEILKGSLTLIR
jgi:large repetitive protein